MGRINDVGHFALFFHTILGGVASHWLFGHPKPSVRSWGDLKDKFIVQSMEERQLLESVGTLDHIKKRNDESLGNFYTMFNKELPGIDQVSQAGRQFVFPLRHCDLEAPPCMTV